jgi:hypothetical protein
MMSVMTEHRDDLARLVRERRDELGLSVARVAAAADHRDVIASWVSKVELNQLRSAPPKDRLEALARALQLPAVRVLRAAAAQHYGVDEIVSEDGTARAIAENVAEMAPADQAALLAMVEAFAREKRRG